MGTFGDERVSRSSGLLAAVFAIFLLRKNYVSVQEKRKLASLNIFGLSSSHNVTEASCILWYHWPENSFIAIPQRKAEI